MALQAFAPNLIDARLDFGLNFSPAITHETPPKKRGARHNSRQHAPSLTGRDWGPLAGMPAPGRQR
jgi:hypothetical protein